jgi:hypothetical protein
MATSLWNLLEEYKVVIPILQRDYAQGRHTGKVPLIRNRFLCALCKALKEGSTPLELDFVYGYTKTSKKCLDKPQQSFIPLDGQQRITTLFLLHWFIAVKENYLEEAAPKLLKFTYETRHSSRVFCSELVKFIPENFDSAISKSIINQPWFFTAWKNDPTIKSMLTMLDAIQAMISENNLQNVWPLLTSEQPSILFHLLPMDTLGLPDDLYIKMNSRGKELTDFEYVKSRFSELLSDEHATIFNNKIDQDWSDLFWGLYKNKDGTDLATKTDAAFLRFLRFITDMLIANGKDVLEGEFDDFKIFEYVYSKRDNVEFLFASLDTLFLNSKTKPDFFTSIFYTNPTEYTIDKTRLFFQNASADLFRKCADNYDSKQRINPFSIGEQLLLYACIVHLKSKSSNFNERIRKLRNLITNSEDTVRRENLSNLLRTVIEIITNDVLDTESKFNNTQAKEEEEKSIFIQQHISLQDTIYRLEDHHLLQGCIAIFKLLPDLEDYAVVFHKIFTVGCDYDEIGRALLTFGDYSQKYDWRRRFGNQNNSVWRELFTPSQRRGGFLNTQNVLYAFLSHLHKEAASTIDSIIRSYLALFEVNPTLEKNFRFYFIKYPGFRKNEDGFYYWEDETKPYQCTMMRRSMLGGFHWSPFLFTLKEASDTQMNLENYGAPLIYVKGNATIKLFNENIGFRLEAIDDLGYTLLNNAAKAGCITSSFVYEVKQTLTGIDVDDRIEKGVDLINSINKLSDKEL